jgi:hypothetical protein
MMRRTVAGALIAVAAAAATSGCGVVYIPGEADEHASTTNPAELRKLVRVVPTTCDRRAAAGTVSNPSQHPLAVVVAVSWTAATGSQKRVLGTVGVAAGATVRWKVRAPRGASDEAGCSTAVDRVSVGTT